MESPPRNEFKTILVAALMGIIAMSGIVAAMVTGNVTENASETAGIKQQDLQLPNEVSQADHSNESAATPAATIPPQPFSLVSDDRGKRLARTSQTSITVTHRLLTETELRNTFRDLFRIPGQQPPASRKRESERNEDAWKARVHQSRTILNDPTLQSQSSLWKFLFKSDTTNQSSVASVEAARRLPVFLTRAFRRPVSNTEIQSFVETFDESFHENQSFQKAMLQVIEAALTSREFLYIQVAPMEKVNSQYVTANRISYLLWGTMPDDEMMMAAREGRLADESAVRQVVRRLLKNERSRGFAQRFGSHWLEQSNLNGEQLGLLDKAFSKNQSILDLIDASENHDALATLAKTDRPSATWLLRVLFHSDPQSPIPEENAKEYLSQWLGVPADDVQQIRRLVLEDRQTYTKAFVRHMLDHVEQRSPTVSSSAPASSRKTIEDIVNAVTFNQYRAHNLIEEVVVHATLGSDQLSSNSRRMTAEKRMRR